MALNALGQLLLQGQARARCGIIPTQPPIHGGVGSLQIGGDRTADETQGGLGITRFDPLQQGSAHHKVAHLAGSEHHDVGLGA